MQYVELAPQRPLLRVLQRRQYHNFTTHYTLSTTHYIIHHIAHRMPLHLHAAHRRVGASDAGEHQFQVFVYLSLGAHRRARIRCVHLLLDGYCRRQAVYVVHIGLRHAPEELAGIRTQALHIAPLTFGEQRVESQARLAAATEAGDDNQLALRQVEVDILQVIGAGAFDADVHRQPLITTHLFLSFGQPQAASVFGYHHQRAVATDDAAYQRVLALGFQYLFLYLAVGSDGVER